MFNLVQYFREAKERRAAATAHKVVCQSAVQAIREDRVADISAILDANQFAYRERSRLLVAAILQDNPASFRVVLDKLFDGNTNNKIHDHSPSIPEGPVYSSETYLLTFALNNGKNRVALAIANDPKTDVTLKGSSYRSEWISGGFMSSGRSIGHTTEHDSAIELARKGGNQDVIAAVTSRLAANLRQQAQKLELSLAA